MAKKQAAAAIKKCDAVIAGFTAKYGARKEKIYCARTSEESLLYLLMAAAKSESAIALSSTWAGAYFLKGYALFEQGRIREARAAINLAVALSPLSPQYLCELGAIYQLEKNWPKAREAFTAAEDHAPLSPDDTKAAELGRARRGLGYVLVELGQLAQAEKKYQQCLAADPKDDKAKRELEYVRKLIAKGK